jgi:two-component system phosphate regulon sensor histidine kinase PhoR
MKLDAAAAVQPAGVAMAIDRSWERSAPMRDAEKTKAQLIAEIASLRAQLESLQAERHAGASERTTAAPHRQRPRANGAHGASEAPANGTASDRRAFRDLRSQLDLTQLIATNLGEGVGVLDARGRARFLNPAAQELLGWAEDELLGKNMHEAVHFRHPDGTPFPKEACPLAAVLRTGEVVRVHEDHFIRKDGSLLPVAYVSVPIVTEGKITGAVLAFHDITERLRVEQERAELLKREQLARAEAEAANERLRLLQAIIESALAHLAPEALLEEVLPQVREALRLDTVAVLLLNEDDDTLSVYAADGLGAEALADIRVPVERATTRHLASARRPLLLDDLSGLDLAPRFPAALKFLAGVSLRVERRVLGLLVVGAIEPRTFSRDDARLLQLVADRIALALDRAQAYQAERRARALVEKIADQILRQAAELDTIIDAIPSGVIVCDQDGRVVRVNAYGMALLGQRAHEGQRESPFARRLYHPSGEPMPPEEYPLARALRGETASDFRCMLHRKNHGEDLELLASYAPLYDSTGEITGAVCVATDITNISRLERQKDEFLSVASHELKTPLTSLKILTQLTQRRLARAGVVEAEQLVGMERSIWRMELLVNDLLDVSRIEGGKLALRIEESDLVAVCRAVAEEQMAASERSIELDLPRAPLMVPMDAERIAQVIANLLSNALKYSPADCRVTLRARHEGGSALVSVRDEGAGIPPDAQEQLFERFYRVPGVQVQTGSGVGMGLGLYISREIVERHGGRIWVESAVGEGTTFFFSLPMGR